MRSTIIGIGTIGKVHASILAERGQLAAICDLKPEKKELYPDVPFYTDWREMLREARPDAVHICTPHYLHAEMILTALAAGIPVLCEKPVCISERELEQVLEAEKHSRVPLGFCLQNRYNPEAVFTRNYLADKTVLRGTAHMVWHRTAEYYAADPWRGKWSTEGGGVLINQALHTLDLLQLYAGMPEKLTAFTANLTLKDKIEVEDTAVLLGSGGADLSFFATNGAGGDLPVEWTIRTETDLLKIMPGHVWLNGVEQPLPKDEEKALGKACYGSSHARLIADYYDCLAENRPFPVNAEAAANVMRLIFAAYRSRGLQVDV